MSLPKRAAPVHQVDWHADNCRCPICSHPHPADRADRPANSAVATSVLGGFAFGQGLCAVLDWINDTRGLAAFWGL